MKKRVLQLIGSFHQGGSERQAVALTRLLKTDGMFDVRVATLKKDGVLLEEVESLGLGEIPEFPLSSFFNPNFVKQVRQCAAYLKKQRIDVVHTHDFYTNVFGMAAATLAGTRRIASKRETGGMRSRAQELVERAAFGRADAIVVNSAAVRQYLLKSSVDEAMVTTIYNGINVRKFEIGEDRKSICPRFGLPAEKRFVTIVANLRHLVKNVPMFLRAAKGVDMENVHFVVAGEGELEHGLKAMAAEIGIAGRAHFIGRCTDVPALLSISDVCVLTSTAEGFSNSILEYMAAGKPVVATDVGGASEAIVDGETGFLVPSDDDAAMAGHLLGLLRDQPKAALFGGNGRQRVGSLFSTDPQLNKTKGLYNSVLDQ